MLLRTMHVVCVEHIRRGVDSNYVEGGPSMLKQVAHAINTTCGNKA